MLFLKLYVVASQYISACCLQSLYALLLTLAEQGRRGNKQVKVSKVTNVNRGQYDLGEPWFSTKAILKCKKIIPNAFGRFICSILLLIS